MNWTGGRLQRQTKRGKSKQDKQKQHFAKVRTHLQNGFEQHEGFVPSYLQDNNDIDDRTLSDRRKRKPPSHQSRLEEHASTAPLAARLSSMIPRHKDDSQHSRQSRSKFINQIKARQLHSSRAIIHNTPSQAYAAPSRSSRKDPNSNSKRLPDSQLKSIALKRLDSNARNSSRSEPSNRDDGLQQPDPDEPLPTSMANLEQQRRKLLGQSDWLGLKQPQRNRLDLVSDRGKEHVAKRRKLNDRDRIRDEQFHQARHRVPSIQEKYMMRGALQYDDAPDEESSIRIRIGHASQWTEEPRGSSHRMASSEPSVASSEEVEDGFKLVVSMDPSLGTSAKMEPKDDVICSFHNITDLLLVCSILISAIAAGANNCLVSISRSKSTPSCLIIMPIRFSYRQRTGYSGNAYKHQYLPLHERGNEKNNSHMCLLIAIFPAIALATLLLCVVMIPDYHEAVPIQQAPSAPMVVYIKDDGHTGSPALQVIDPNQQSSTGNPHVTARSASSETMLLDDRPPEIFDAQAKSSSLIAEDGTFQEEDEEGGDLRIEVQANARRAHGPIEGPRWRQLMGVYTESDAALSAAAPSTTVFTNLGRGAKKPSNVLPRPGPSQSRGQPTAPPHAPTKPSALRANPTIANVHSVAAVNKFTKKDDADAAWKAFVFGDLDEAPSSDDEDSDHARRQPQVDAPPATNMATMGTSSLLTSSSGVGPPSSKKASGSKPIVQSSGSSSFPFDRPSSIANASTTATVLHNKRSCHRMKRGTFSRPKNLDVGSRDGGRDAGVMYEKEDIEDSDLRMGVSQVATAAHSRKALMNEEKDWSVDAYAYCTDFSELCSTCSSRKREVTDSIAQT